MRIAWIGTGVMGGPMAGHLLAAGHTVTVHTRTRAKANALLQRGARWADSPRAAAAGAEAACVMVGFPADVESVVLGPEGALAALPAGALLVDFTTSRPSLAMRIAKEADVRGVLALDAPVSGGDVGARAGQLTILAGGSDAAFQAAGPILACFGKTVTHQGPAGSGQRAKLVNQILIAGVMMGMCEGLLFARRAGLNPETVLEGVSGGAAGSWSLSNLAPRILAGNYRPGFYVEHFLKDLGLALEEAAALHLDLPALALAKRLYEAVREGGGAKLGTQALALALERMNPPVS